MHYILGEYIVESELAAKSVLMPNKIILDYISKLSPNYIALDYGCGKLRHAIPLANYVQQVIAIDSREQLEKKQRIHNSIIAPVEYCKENLTILPLDSDGWRKQKYDFVLCSNVLSAIPDEIVRMNVLSDIISVLKKEGHLLLSVQYYNSYYNSYRTRKDAFPYLDGWLVKRRGSNKYDFYAMLNAECLIGMCRKVGFRSFTVKKIDGSCYISARIQ